MSNAPIPASTLTIPEKLNKLVDTVAGTVYERSHVIQTQVVAMTARMHHVQVGEPGIGKTQTINELVSHTDLTGGLDHFYWLLGRTTAPDELFGSVSLKGLENDQYRRNIQGKLPTSKTAFLDEMFKANSACLNALLTLMNERLFFNDGVAIDCPLWSIFAGSNELPKDPELAAFWDRMTFRIEVKRMKERSNLKKMFAARAARAAASTLPHEVIVTSAEIEQAQTEASRVIVPDDVLDTFLDLVDKLGRENIEPSPRRLNDCIPVIQATAYLDGRTVAEVDDMRLLRHVLWLDMKDQPVVDRLVMELANPLDKAAMDLLETIDKLASEAETLLKSTDNKQARRRQGIEIHGKLNRCNDELDELYKKAQGSRKRSDMIEEARTRLSNVVDTMLFELFDMPPGTKP